MTDRVLPTPDRFAVCPLDGAILPFYEGVFEAAYVVLNPFLRLKPGSVAPDHSAWQDMTPHQTCAVYEAVPWSQVLALCDWPSIDRIDIALRTMIGGLRRPYADPALADVLERTLQRHGLIPPAEGVFPELVRAPMLSFIRSLGQDWLWAGDGMGTERKLYWIDDLMPGGSKQMLRYDNLFTPDTAQLWTVHWDSHFTLFCSSAENVAKLAQHPALEGFVCGPETEVYWGCQSV